VCALGQLEEVEANTNVEREAREAAADLLDTELQVHVQPTSVCVATPQRCCWAVDDRVRRRAGRNRSVATPQATIGRSRPPDSPFKIQSCFCLGSAFEVAAPEP
jgi:hypothetical protein